MIGISNDVVELFDGSEMSELASLPPDVRPRIFFLVV